MGRWVLRASVTLIFIFLLLPIGMAVCQSFAASPVLAFPPTAFTLRWYQNISPSFIAGLKISLIVACGTMVLATLVGVPAALALVRARFPGRDFVNVLLLSPLMVPTLVIGVAAFRFALKASDWLDVPILGTIPGVILAQTAFTVPFVIRSAIAGQALFDMEVENAAQNLGATPLQAFFKITLPILAPGISSGAIFAFLTSLDDVPVSLFVGGGDAATLPVRIFTSIQFSFDADVMAVATIIVGLSMVLMFVLDRIMGLDKFFGVARS